MRILISFLYTSIFIISTGYTDSYRPFDEDQLVATYIYEKENLGWSTEFQLKINGGTGQYIHHHKYQMVTNEKGWEFYFHHDYYDWHLDLSSQQITEQKMLEDGTLLYTQYPADMEWEITGETKELMGYTVQKAITKAYDRTDDDDYTKGDAIAWFTTELPFSFGPERYYGLPGLIIQLEYTNTSYKAYLKDISFEEVGNLEAPAGGITVTKQQIMWPNMEIDKKWLKKAKKEQAAANQ